MSKNVTFNFSLKLFDPTRGAPTISPYFKNILIIKAMIEGASFVSLQNVSHLTMIKKLM